MENRESDKTNFTEEESISGNRHAEQVKGTESVFANTEEEYQEVSVQEKEAEAIDEGAEAVKGAEVPEEEIMGEASIMDAQEGAEQGAADNNIVESEAAEDCEQEDAASAGEPSVREYYYEESIKRHPKKRRGLAKFVAGCLIVSVTGGGSIGAGYGLVEHYFLKDEAVVVTRTPISAQQVSRVGEGLTTVEIVKNVKPSVVSISTKVIGKTDYFGSFSIPYEMNGAGSGIIFYNDENQVGIVTNNHVIDNAESIYVTLSDDVTVPAKVIGTQAESDLAVISVDWADLKKEGVTDISVATFGDSSKLEVGESVIAIGNAMGMGLSATDGMISMTEQKIVVDGTELPVLQTSAAINGGNSGGPLVNSTGEVIGINTAKYNSSMAEGMGYAIPSDVITPIVETLFEEGTQPKPYIGIKGTSITTENAELYKLPVGALIMEVTVDSPAADAGLLVGDIVTEFNGKTIMNMDALSEAVSEVKIGSSVSVHVIRNGEESVDLTIAIADKNS